MAANSVLKTNSGFVLIALRPDPPEFDNAGTVAYSPAMFRHLFLAVCCLLLVSAGCRRPAPSGPPITLENLILDLARPDRMARLDVPGTQIITSFDPGESNDDFNHFVRKGPPGWVVLADLQGPGYVSRFWFTGADDGKHGLRFYVDGSTEPTLNTTVGNWCGGLAPNLPPLAAYENYCWYSYVPISYARSLVIMAQEGATKSGGWPRLFYQINYSQLPKDQPVESFNAQWSPAQRDALAKVTSFWAGGFKDAQPAGEIRKGELTIQPGQSGEILHATGPARITSLALSYEAPVSAASRDRILRDVILRMNWDSAPTPSVEVPLGDFFGSFWQPRRYESMFFGMRSNGFICRFPMPFRSEAGISLENQGSTPVKFMLEAQVEALTSWDSNLGYLHAAWNKTRPQDTGRAHPILRAQGKGKFVGCLLSATSFDKSWWLLEGDETIRVDKETKPGWHGTGLEDYFNGGWYYQNVGIRPLHGLPFKAHFRTVQYRLQLVDPVYFTSSIDMMIERGPNNGSHGDLESVAYYYGEKPSASASHVETASRRAPPLDGLAPITLTMELCNFERLGDYQGAKDHLDAFLERYPDFPFQAVLPLRRMAYDEKLSGFPAVKADYESFAASQTNNALAEQARSLLWFQEDAQNALMAMYCNLETTVFLDGRKVGEANDPERMIVNRLQVGPGPHTLIVQGKKKQPAPFMDWVQVCLRTHQGNFYTTPQWRWAYGPARAFAVDDPEARDWPEVGGTGVKGPPEEPFLWTEPNAFIDTQSLAVGLRPSHLWPPGQEFITYRTVFEIP